MMTAFGCTHDQIASILKISVPTLHANFRRELDHGMMLANIAVAKNLFHWATNPKDARAINAAKFWLSMRANWRDNYTVPVQPNAEQGEDDAPLPKLGKKEQAALDARTPDTSTDMGALMAKRMASGSLVN